MSYEDSMNRTIDGRTGRREELSPVLRTAYEKSILILKDPDNVIQESAFESVYGIEQVRRDVAQAGRLEKKFAERDTPFDKVTRKIAQVFEAIILEQSQLSEWLGTAHVLKTARFDDFTNKTDIIAEWYSPEDGSRVLALAIDVTFGGTAVAGKMRAIKDEVDRDVLGSLRYFKDARGDFMGTRNNVPRVVIGLSQEALQELAAVWVKNDKKALAAHPVQRLIIEEIMAQIQTIHSYAIKNNRTSAAQAYAQALAAVRALAAQKREVPLGELATDKVAEAIAWNIKNLFVA